MAAEDIALDLAEALPKHGNLRSEIIAVGMLATALIAESQSDQRAELVELFCNLVRKGVAKELN